MKSKRIILLLPILMLSSCNDETTNSNTTNDVEFKFQVLANVDYYNGNKNYVMYDEENGYYADVNLGTNFYIPFRYSPLNYPNRDIEFYIEDESICRMDTTNIGRVNTLKRGVTTVSIEPTYFPDYRVDIRVRVL